MLSRLRRRIRSARAANGTDAGVTLTELLVALGLSTLLGAMTLTMFISVNSSSAATTDRTIGAASARDVLQSWTAYLRVADGPTPGNAAARVQLNTGTDLMFFAGIGNRTAACASTNPTTGLCPPTLLWLRLDTGGNLVEEQFTGSMPLTNASPNTCRILATSVSATPLFTGYDAHGAQLPTFGTSPTSSSGCQPLSLTPTSSTASSSLTSVAIAFTITDTAKTHSQQYTSVATLPALTGS